MRCAGSAATGVRIQRSTGVGRDEIPPRGPCSLLVSFDCSQIDAADLRCRTGEEI
ncbi:unnamed protein product, partial [Musa acuminata var. zebrina]